MRVEIWSDVVCPWCYIGKRRFETAVERVQGLPGADKIEIVYRPYQLDPSAAPGRVQPVVEAYAKKFGGEERAAQIIGQVTSVAAADGITFNMDIALRANTLMAHRLLWLAESRGNQIELKERLLRAYFTEGLNISDPDVLVTCATEVGFEAGEVRAFLDSDAGHGEVMEDLAQAAAVGITAVPTLVFNGQLSVPGAQDIDVFERVLERLLAKEAEQLQAEAEAAQLTDGQVCVDNVCDV